MDEDYRMINEDRLPAILSYLTLIGWIIAIILHSSNRNTRLGAFHIKQSIGLIATGIALSMASFILAYIPVIGWLVLFTANITLIVFWILGFVSAIKGEIKPLPFVGEYYQKIFDGVAR